MNKTLLPPLTPAEFYILLALINKSLDGIGIRSQAESYSAGTVVLQPGTLYEAIARLKEEKLIEPAVAKTAKSPDRRRKYYRITANGKQVLEFEVQRLKHAYKTAQRLGLI